MPAQADTLTYPDLVQRLTDLDRLASPPQKGETVALDASYDHRRQYDAKNDPYLNWSANNDHVTQTGDHLEMGDLKGLRVIWRMWSARPGKGRVKIYIDGVPTPTVDLPFKAYFDGSSAPFNRPHLAYTTGGGGDNYTPIPQCR